MTLGFLFWLLMVLWFFFGAWHFWPNQPTGPVAYAPLGANLLLFALLFILGWRVFGFVIQG